MDTAKRCLRSGVFRDCFVKEQKTRGKHSRVVAEDWETAKLYCLVALDLRRLRIRKPYLRQAMPLLSSENLDDSDCPDEADDSVDGVPHSPRELLEHLNKEMPDSRPREIQASPDQHRRQSIALLLLLWAATALQKSGQAVTVANLSKRMRMSIASIYRPPYGRGLVNAAIKRAVGSGESSVLEALDTESSDVPTSSRSQQVIQNGLRPRPADHRSYAERRDDKLKRRERLSEHYIFWHTHRHPDGMFTGALRIAPAICVPEDLRKRFTPRACAAWLASKYPQLRCNAVVVGGIAPTKSGKAYRWHSQFGPAKRGIAKTFNNAKKRILETIKPGITLKRITVLNHEQGGD